MRFTLGTLVGVALGVVAAPIVASTPGLGPAVTDAQTQAWKLLRARMAVSSLPDELRPEATPEAGPEARSESRRARAKRSNPPPRHAGIVSLAAIAAAQPEAGDADLARTPIPSTGSTPDASADTPIPYSRDGDARAHDAPANPHANTRPEIENDVGIETETRTDIGDRPVGDYGDDHADAALDQQVGVLDRLFATYDRVDEE